MINTKKIIAAARSYCEQKEEIVIGLLFGSYAGRYPCAESDIDIAVYLENESERLETEIQTELERLLKKRGRSGFVIAVPGNLILEHF